VKENVKKERERENERRRGRTRCVIGGRAERAKESKLRENKKVKKEGRRGIKRERSKNGRAMRGKTGKETTEINRDFILCKQNGICCTIIY